MTIKKELEKAAGKLIIGRMPGTSLDDENKNLLKKGIMGGAVLFKENGTDVTQLTALCDDIRQNCLHAAVIAVDEEGGAVQRFEHFLTAIPSAMALCSGGDLDVLVRLYTSLSAQLRAVGFNCLLAPVMDVLSSNINPVIATRAFSDNPHTVSAWAEASLQAISAAQLVPVGKHFPGHGSTEEDSHLDLAQSKLSDRQLWQLDLLPYRKCLEKLPAIMTGHIWLKSVEENPLPASLSKRVINGILRDYLGFNGVVITDDLTMRAITDRWGLAEAAVMALEAGNDLLLVCSGAENVKAVNERIVEAVRSGRLTEQQLKDSGERLDKCFAKVNDFSDHEASRSRLKETIAQEKQTSMNASVRGISLLRGKVPEISSGNWIVLVPNHARYPMRVAAHLRELLKGNKYNKKNKDLNLQFTELKYSVDPSQEEIEQVASECIERNCILLTYRALSNQGQLLLGSQIASNARETVSVCCDLPYDILGLPTFDNCLATFDPSDQAMRALAIVLLNGEQPEGVCPVSLEFLVSGRSFM
jgi:beta-N-acetylhexosaminidase